MPAISVIVPVYKVEPYLHRCVDSILNQTFSDFELILVDDGSPDNCPKICDEYAEADSRVHVIHQKNGGLSAARNAGIDWAFANSDSQWLTFIDSDDWVHPEMLERLLNAAEENHVAVSICKFVKTEGETPPNGKNGGTYLWKPEDYYIQYVINATTAWGKLYKKYCFQTLRYPVGKIHEDEFTTYRILFAEKNIVVVDTQMYYYYSNPDGITKSCWTPKRMDAFEAYREQFCFFREYGNTKILTQQIKHCLYTYKRQIEELQGQDTYGSYIRVLQKEMRKLILSSWKLQPLSFPKDTWVYETAFPVTMRFYWKIHSIIHKNKEVARL